MIVVPRRPLAVLLVEDDEEDYLITRDMLALQQVSELDVEWCATFETGQRAIAEGRHDVYVFDYRLGAHTGLELAREVFASRPSAAVILLTSQDDPQLDLEATALGVTDFLLKQELSPSSLERSIRYAVRHQRAVRELARSEERYELAARAVNDGIWDWDLTTGQVHYSGRWHSMLGRPEPVGPGRPETWFELVHPEDLPRLRAAVDAHTRGAIAHLQSEHRMRHADGSWRWMLSRGLAIRDTAGVATRMAGSLSDITARRRAQEQLQHHAFFDVVTDLPNRALFVDRLERAVRRYDRDPSTRHAVLFIDLDRFKLINDTFSHGVGDQLLRASAVRLTETVRAVDTVARLGGDEFTVLVEHLPVEDVTRVVTELAGRVQENLSRGFTIDGRRLHVTVSIGIAVATPGSDGAEVLRNADIAMYEAKRRGRNAVVLYDGSMHRRVSDRLRAENDLRLVVDQQLLDVHYQPVIDLRSGRLRGFEALARWPASLPPVAPTVFIPIAEETGLIRQVGWHVLRTALTQLRTWREAGLIASDVLMSVNVSARQLDDPRFADDVLGALAEAGLPGSVLRLEITESTLMRDPERLGPLVSALGHAGLGLELDDFGTGYSSLAALHRFPVGALKVDRSFVASLTEGTSSEAIVRSTVALAHSLGLAVVAEGIEAPEQLARLRSLGCEYGQGYLFARPADAGTLDGLLRRGLATTINLADGAAPVVELAGAAPVLADELS